MIGLDTNVLVRYVAQDDPKQSPRATELIESLTRDNPGFISLVAIVELVWVMHGCYGASKVEVISVLEQLLRVNTIFVENAEIVLQAVHLYDKSDADFADCLIARSGSNALCIHTITFDNKAAKIDGLLLLQ